MIRNKGLLETAEQVSREPMTAEEAWVDWLVATALPEANAAVMSPQTFDYWSPRDLIQLQTVDRPVTLRQA